MSERQIRPTYDQQPLIDELEVAVAPQFPLGRLLRRAVQALRSLSELYVDERGTTWVPPTAEAYARVCAARDQWQARAEYLRSNHPLSNSDRDEFWNQVDRDVADLAEAQELERDANPGR